jgi:glucose/arabinose dehydrogenase
MQPFILPQPERFLLVLSFDKDVRLGALTAARQSANYRARRCHKHEGPRKIMTRFTCSTASSVAALLATSTLVLSDDVRTGKSAYGDWQTDAPGVTRKITVNDLAPPLETPSTANRSSVVAKPADAVLKTMPGFSIAPFVTGMEGARVIRVAPNGDIFLSLSRPEGKVMVLRTKPGAEKPDRIETFASGLNDPYGIAFYPPGADPKWVYVAGTKDIVRYPYRAGDMKASGQAEIVVSDLAVGGSHWTRDVVFSPDGTTMYVAVGSSGNVAQDMGSKPELVSYQQSHAVGSAWDKEEWRANVLAYDADGKNKRVYAAGIRNCSGLAVQPGTGTVFCATNERDLLGDNLPPDYVTSVKPGGFYGWPWYYIGDHEDTRPGGGTRSDLKGKVTIPDVLLQPHSAPLGLAFNGGAQFPAEWKGDAFVALHGSWNRALRTGYKIVRLPFKDGKATGEYQDFVVGFTAGQQNVWGRPVDVAFAQDGSLLFSDDGNGVVYRVSYKRP